MKKALIPLLVVSLLSLSGCNEASPVEEAHEEAPQEVEDSQERTAHSLTAYASGEDEEVEESHFVYETNIPAYVGSTLDLADYITYVSADDEEDRNYEIYLLSDGSEPAASMDASSSRITFLRAKTCYLNVEKGETYATITIDVKANFVSGQITSFFSSLGDSYETQVSSFTSVRTPDYLYSDDLRGGYLLTSENNYYQYRLSSEKSDDLEVVMPRRGSRTDYLNVVGSLEACDDANLGYLANPITVGSTQFRYALTDTDAVRSFFSGLGLTKDAYVLYSDTSSGTYYPYAALFAYDGEVETVLLLTDGYSLVPLAVESITPLKNTISVLDDYIASADEPAVVDPTFIVEKVASFSDDPNFTLSGDYTLTDPATGKEVQTDSLAEYRIFGVLDLKATDDYVISGTYSSVTETGSDGEEIFHYLDGGLVSIDGQCQLVLQNAEKNVPIEDSYSLQGVLEDSLGVHPKWYNYSYFSDYRPSNTINRSFFRNMEVTGSGNSVVVTPFTEKGLDCFNELIDLVCYYNFLTSTAAYSISNSVHPRAVLTAEDGSFIVDIYFTAIAGSISVVTKDVDVHIHAVYSDFGTTSIPGIEALLA